MLLQCVRSVCQGWADGIDYIEDMLHKQLVAAIGMYNIFIFSLLSQFFCFACFLLNVCRSLCFGACVFLLERNLCACA